MHHRIPNLTLLARPTSRKTHDLFVEYLRKQPGWKVTPHAHGLETAFAAEFTHSTKSARSTSSSLPTVGFQS